MTESYPVLPLRDIVVFPQMIVPLFVGRDKSVAALESAMAADKSIFLVSQLDPAEDDPDRDALYDHRRRRHRPPAAEAARRHGARAGRGPEPRDAEDSAVRRHAISIAEVEPVDDRSSRKAPRSRR